MKICTVLGARPQFVKAAPVSRVLRDRGHHEMLVHTGQHYGKEMSAVFFEQLQLRPPAINLRVGSASHGRQTGQILARVEGVLARQKPDCVIVYGDTNSTLAGALAACKLHIPLVHVEAGARSFNRDMPEEHNRVLTDHCSDLLLCPTRTTVDNLLREGLSRGVQLVGDTMLDAVRHYAPVAEATSSILSTLGVDAGTYVLLTVHRPVNSDHAENLQNILRALDQADIPVIFPVHPRTQRLLRQLGKTGSALQIRTITPVGYLQMLILEKSARVVATDSGGVQKEAYFFGVPCVTLRSETEWLETVAGGWNQLVGSDPEQIIDAVRNIRPDPAAYRPDAFGDGHASRRVAEAIEELAAGVPPAGRVPVNA